MPANLSDIFLGVTKAPVRDYVGSAVAEYKPEYMVHPCVGRYGALMAAIAGGHLPPASHYASDLNLYTSVVGYLADPHRRIAELELKPNEEVDLFFDDADQDDDFNYAARVMLGMKYVQLPATNRFMEGHRRELRLRQEDHVATLEEKLRRVVQMIEGIHYRAENLWDVLTELEEQPPQKKSMLFLSPPWYEGGYSKMFAAAEEAFAWPGLTGREFSPDDLGELLERSNAIEKLAVIVLVRGKLDDAVPEGYKRVMSWVDAGDIERTYSNVDLKKYAPQRIRRLNPRPVRLWTDADEVREDSKVEVVPIDEDTALYVRDLFVHKLGTTASDGAYVAIQIDGKIISVHGLNFHGVVGAMGTVNGYVVEIFGVVRTTPKFNRFNRLAPLVLTSGETRRFLQASQRQLQLREMKGVQTADFRPFNDASKNKRGIFKVVKKEQQPGGLWKIVSRGDFRDDTWADCWAKWYSKWAPTPDTEQEAVRG
jgi:hypothetical protein